MRIRYPANGISQGPLFSSQREDTGPEAREVYEQVRRDAQTLMAPMLNSHNDVLRVAALRDIDQIPCRKDDNKRDSRTGNIIPEIKTQDILIERKAIQFTIGGQDFVVSNEKDASLIRSLAEYFDLPEVRTVAELDPEGFRRWCDRVRRVVARYA